jgi:hypothetical protein
MSSMTFDQIETQLKELKKIEDTTPDIYKKLDDEFWIVGALRNLYELCKKYDQVKAPEFEDGKDYTYAKRVIKVNTWCDEIDLQRYKIDHAMFFGMFVAIDGIFIKKDITDNYFMRKINRREVLDPTDIKSFGLPDDIAYETIRRTNDGYGFALKKSEFINGRIRSFNYWEYLNL